MDSIGCPIGIGSFHYTSNIDTRSPGQPDQRGAQFDYGNCGCPGRPGQLRKGPRAPNTGGPASLRLQGPRCLEFTLDLDLAPQNAAFVRATAWFCWHPRQRHPSANTVALPRLKTGSALRGRVGRSDGYPVPYPRSVESASHGQLRLGVPAAVGLHRPPVASLAP